MTTDAVEPFFLSSVVAQKRVEGLPGVPDGSKKWWEAKSERRGILLKLKKTKPSSFASRRLNKATLLVPGLARKEENFVLLDHVYRKL